jgi:hypothetical protein
MVLIEVYLATGVNVSSYSMPSFWEKPRATNIALYFSILPSAACFILKSYLEDTTYLFFSLGTISHTSFQERMGRCHDGGIPHLYSLVWELFPILRSSSWIGIPLSWHLPILSSEWILQSR